MMAGTNEMTFMRRSPRSTIARIVFTWACVFSMPAWANIEKAETEVVASEDESPARERVLEEAKKGPSETYSWIKDTVPVEELERTETAIRRLTELVSGTPEDNPRRAEYMFRLAELYTERTQFYEERAYQRRDQAFLEEDENPQRAAAYRRAAEGDLEQSERYARQAASLYGELYSGYRDSFDEMDAVLYYLGSNFLQYEQRDAAVQIYEELARSYPTSDYLPQAMLMLGEIAFEDGNIKAAVDYYDVVIQSPDSPAYPYALYKKSWALYNMASSGRAFRRALNLLYDAVEESRAREAQGSRALSLTRQALRDVPLFYSEVYEGKVAPALFDRITGDTEQADSLLERLGLLYGDRGMYSDSNAVYRALIERNPESFQIVGWQTEIVNNTRPESDDVEVVRELRRLMQLYNTALDYDDVTPELKKQTTDKIEALLRLVATTYHKEAQVTLNEEYYALAYNLYEDYVANFPDGNEAYVMWYYYASLQYRNEDWSEAAESYERVLTLGEGEGEFDEDASYSSCLAYTKMVDLQPTTLGTDESTLKEGQELPEIPEAEDIPEEYTRMMNACDRYLATTTDEELAAELDYVLAYIYYDYNHFDEAVKRFGEFALERDDVDRERAVASADLVLDSLALQRKWGEMREWISRLQDSRLNTGDFAGRLATLREQVSFRECRDLQQRKDYQGSAYCFFDFVNDNPNSEFVDRAIFNAATSFREIDNLDYSISLMEQLPVLAPGSDLVPDTLYELGRSFHRLAVYDTAADNYEAYVTADPDGEHVINAMANAAQFRHGLGQHKQAIEDYKRYQRLARKDAEHGAKAVAEAAYQIAKVRDERGDGSYAIREYRDFVRRYGNDNPSRAVEAMARQGDMYLDRNNQRDGYGRYEDTVKYVDKMDTEERAKLTNAARDAVSRAAFMLADRIYDEFEAVDLNAKTADGIRDAVEKKVQMGQKAEKAFDPVIRVYARPGWMIASLTRLGQMRHVFFEQIIDAPVPPGLDPLVEEEYRTELENRAADVKQEAMDFYRQAIHVARENNWFNDYSELAARQLQELDRDFASGSEIRISPGFDSSKPYVLEYIGARERIRESSGDTRSVATVPTDDDAKTDDDDDASDEDDMSTDDEGAAE